MKENNSGIYAFVPQRGEASVYISIDIDKLGEFLRKNKNVIRKKNNRRYFAGAVYITKDKARFYPFGVNDNKVKDSQRFSRYSKQNDPHPNDTENDNVPF